MSKVIFKTKTQKHNDFQKELKRNMKEADIFPHGNIEIARMEDGSILIRNADKPFQIPLEQEEATKTRKFILQDDYNDVDPRYIELTEAQKKLMEWLQENSYIHNATLVDLDEADFEKI